MQLSKDQKNGLKEHTAGYLGAVVVYIFLAIMKKYQWQ